MGEAAGAVFLPDFSHLQQITVSEQDLLYGEAET
jgi:hypothetical protein